MGKDLGMDGNAAVSAIYDLAETAAKETAKEVERKTQQISKKNKAVVATELSKFFKEVFGREMKQAEEKPKKNITEITKVIGELKATFKYTAKNAQPVQLSLEDSIGQLVSFTSTLKEVDKAIKDSILYDTNSNKYTGTVLNPTLEGLKGWDTKWAEQAIKEQKEAEEKLAEQQEKERKARLDANVKNYEKQLKESQNRLQEIITKANGAMGTLGLEGLSNEKLFSTKRGTKYNQKDLSKAIKDLYDPETVKLIHSYLESAVKEAKSIQDLDGKLNELKQTKSDGIADTLAKVFLNDDVNNALNKYRISADNIQKNFVSPLKKGDTSGVKELKKIISDLSKETSQLDPSKLSESLDILRAVRNVFEQFEFRQIEFKGINIAGGNFKSSTNLNALIQGIEKGLPFDANSISALARKSPKGSYTQNKDTDVGKKQKQIAKEIENGSKEIAKKADEAAKRNENSIKKIFDGAKVKSTNFEFTSLESLQNIAKGLYSTVQPVIDKKGNQTGWENDRNLSIIKTEVRSRIVQAEEVSQELIKLIEFYAELSEKMHSPIEKLSAGGQQIQTPEQLRATIPYLQDLLKQQESAKAKKDDTAKTEVGKTADQITKDSEQLEQATQKAEQVVQKAEEVQTKAKRTRTKKTTTDDTTSGTGDGTGGAGVPITPTISREALQQALDKMSEGQPFSVKVGAVNADTGVDVTNLVDKINETLKTVPVIVYLVHGSNPIDISNLVDRINETFKETPVTVSVVNGATELKIDELKTTIETKLTEAPPKITVISAIEDINIADVINAINNKLKTAQVVVENVTGSEQMNTDTLRQYLKNSLKDAVVEIHNVAMSEDLNAETLANGITDKLKGQTVKVENIEGDVKEGDSNLATYISGKLKGQPVYVDTIGAAEPLNIEDLVTKIQTSLTNQPFTVKTIQADTSLDISKLVGAIETAIGTKPHKISVDVSEAQTNITNLINSINEVKPLMTVSGKLSVDTEAALLRIDEFKQRINDAKEQLNNVGKINFKPLEDSIDPVNQKLLALKETLQPYTQEQHFMLPSFSYDTDKNQQLENYSKHLDAIQEKISKIANSTKSLQRTGKKISLPDIRVPVNTDTIVKMISYEQSVKSLATALNELKTALEGIKGYQDVIKDVNSLIPKRAKVRKVTAKKKEDSDKSSAEKKKDSQTAVAEAKSEIEQAYKEVGETAKKAAEKAVKDAKDVEMDKILKDILQGTKKAQAQRAINGNVLGDENKEVIKKALTEYDDIVEKIKSKSYDVEKSGEEWRRAQKILQDAMDNTGDTRRAEKYLLKLENLSSKIGNLMANNSKVKNTSVGNQLENLASEINVLKRIQPNSEDVQRVTKEYERLRSLMYETGTSGKGELQKIAATISATFRRVFAGDVTYRLLMKIREVPRVVREIDSAMTDLKRVTTETSDVYDKFLTSAISKSKQLGATVTETIKATSSFGRLGYELNDAAQLAESALIYKNVGWLDIETATNDLVSAMKAFNIEAEDSLRIVDTFNILGNKFALTSADVGTGLKQSASALAVANNSFEESAAMITAITEITQDASSAGNALKTLSLRIRSTKAELSEMGEDAEGAATTTAKLRKQIKGITGVDILKNNNEFKSTYEIMQGIAAVWKDLSDTEQASVLESLAGKVRANQVAALLNNWSQAEKALDESLNSSGTALKENDLYLKSAEGRLSQLKATAQDLALDVFNSDELKTFLKLATDLLNVLTKMKDFAAPMIAGAAIAGTTIKNPSEGVGMRAINLLTHQSTGSILKQQGYINGSKFNLAPIYKQMESFMMANPSVLKGSEEYNKQLELTIGNIYGLNDAAKKQVRIAYENVEAGNAQTLKLKDLGINTVALTIKDYALAAAQTAVNAAIGMGIGLILQLVVKGITALVQAEEKARQAVLDSADALKEETDSIDDYKEKIKELKESLEEGNLTQKEAYEKREELITIQDEIIKKYGLEKESVDLLNNSIETTNALLDEQIEKKSKAWYKSNKTQIEEDEEKLFSKKEGSVGYLPSEEFTGKSALEEILKKYGMFFTPTGEGSVSVDYKDKSLYEQYKLLNDLIDELSNNPQFDNNEYVDKFIERLNQQLTKLNSEKFQAMLSEATEAVEPEILSNKEYSELYKTAQETVENYNTAIKEGNTEAAQEAISNIKELKIQTSNALKDENNLLMQEFFEALFNQVLGNNEQNVQYTMTDIDKKVFSKMYGDKNNTELKLLTTDEGAKGFLAPLQRYADSAGVSIERLIDILADLGVIEKDLTVEIDKARPFKDIVEDIEDAQKAFTSFDNAIAKMTSGDRENAFLTTDELNTLLGYDDTLVDSVEKTAKGYKISAVKLTEARQEYFEKQREGIQANIESNETQIEAYRKTLEELEARQKANPNDKELNQKVDNVTQSIANHEKELKSYKLILNELRDPMIDFSSIVSTITSKTESLSSELTTMSEEQQQFGHITEATAAKFISSNRNWEEFIQLNKDGQYELNKNAEGYENLIAESVGYNEALAGMKNQYDRLLSKSSELQSALQVLAMSGQAGSEEFTDLQDELSLTETELAETGKEVSTLTLLFKMLFKSIGSSQALSTFNTDIKKLKHQLDMGEITKSQYYAQYEQAYNNFAANATEKDQDALDDAEVTNYQNKITEATDNFEKANKRIENSYKNGNITLEQLVAQRRSLIEQYYGANSLLGQTEDGYDKYLDLLQEVSDSETEIVQKSYDDRKKLIEQNTEDHIISIDQQIEELTKLNEEFYNPETGKLGKTREAVDNKIYENNLRDIQDKIKSAFDYWTKEDERSKQMGIITAKEYWENQLALADKYLKDIPQFADEYREIQDAYNTTGQQEMYDEELKLVENAHSLRLKNDKQYWHDRHALAEKYYKNNKAFEKEWIAEDIAYRTEGMRAMYEEDVRLSENAYKRGEISLSAHIQNQINSWKVYYKDKAELREEDLAAQESIRDQYKNGVQEQINALETLKGQQTQQLNDEIDLLEESKAEYERVAQEKEKAIDKEIRALQRQKDAIEKKKKVEEEDYELQKAMMNLYKASMSTRLVYTGGGWELRRDEQKYQDAIKDVDEKKKENQSKQLDTAIQALQDQKTAISDSTQDIVDQIDKDIVERQLAIKSLEAPFDNLIKILTAVMAQMSIENIDPAFLMQIMNSPAGKDAMEQYSQTMAWITSQNKKYAKTGNKAVNEYYSYYPNQKGYNFNTQGEYYTDKDGNRVLVNGKLQGNVSSSNYAVYAQATREALKVAQDSNTSANTKKLLNNFIIDLQKDNMTNEEFMKWMDTLAADSNMTTEDWMKKFGLYDLMATPFNMFDKLNGFVELGRALQGGTEEQTETTEEQPKDVLTTTQGIYSDTSNILKIISDFNKANPNLFVGTEGSKVSTTTDVKGNAGKIADTINNSPVFNINVTGNADKSIVSTMRKELTNAFNEYTDMLTGALGVAHQRQLTT